MRNYAGEVVETESSDRPRPGADLTLTIDAALQKQAEQALDAAISTSPEGEPQQAAPQAGSVIVLDLGTGETLIAASSPRFDLAKIQHPTQQQWQSGTRTRVIHSSRESPKPRSRPDQSSRS